MACEVVRSPDGKVVAILCGSPWGIGIYKTGDPDYPDMYGFPLAQMNPHDFSPDRECCTKEEIKSWKEACAVWDKETSNA